MGKEETKLSLFADDMIVYMENPRDSTKKPLDLINEFDKTAGYKVNTQKSKAFLYTNNKTSETEIRKKNPIQYSNKKNKVPRNKPNQAGKRPILRKVQDTKKENQEDTNKWKHIPCSCAGELTSLKYSHYPKQSIDSTQSLLKYQWHISQIQNKYFKNLYGRKNDPEQPQQS